MSRIDGPKAGREGGLQLTTTYTHITDLALQAEPPEDGILSRTIYNDE